MEYKCSNCEVYEWMGNPLRLHLDHINGDNVDDRIENLRLLCPNCHSQTTTYSLGTKEKQSEKSLKWCRSMIKLSKRMQTN
jgi:Zn finger protein HypA/HybF involved in hydrogenase expression